ncbi:MAG: vanadium-dependent haloperoxidase [Planctomycetota bacterium]
MWSVETSLDPVQRADLAYTIRVKAASQERDFPLPDHSTNGDESLYSNKIANYSKGLPHNVRGEVSLSAYNAFINALNTGKPSDFDAIPLGCSTPSFRRKLVNPQAGLALDLQGADSHHLSQPPAPAFAGPEQAGEMVENYWMALCRDVPFNQYDSHPLTLEACAELSSLSDFRGPKIVGQVTPQSLFRGLTPGDLTGPYISQFLYKPCPFGANYIEQRMRTHVAGLKFMTQYAQWLSVQNGCVPSQAEPFESVRRFISNGRDLGQWVHIDVLFQAYFHACLILGAPVGTGTDPNSSGIGAPLNLGNPYLISQNQEGFATFGPPYSKTLMCEVSTRALKSVWYQKWFVHRRLRPEVFAGRIHNHITGSASYPIHADVLNSQAVQHLFSQNGSYLLPMEYSEGSPLHPSYGAGHATVAGACVTILKAMFDENFVIPNPVVFNPNDPTQLISYGGPALTVGGELNKLANNIAIGRNIAGVHWRSDATESLKLGELVAIRLLLDQRSCYNEKFEGFRFTQFDGTLMTI